MGTKKQETTKGGEVKRRAADAGTDLFHTVFDRIQTGILIIDPATHTIVDANPLAETLIGLTKDRIIGKTCHSFVCPAQAGECPITDQHKTLDNTERVLLNSRGEKVPILKTVVRASSGGREYLIESFVDILDRKRAEDRKLALVTYLNEAVVRVKIPLELTAQNLEEMAARAQVAGGPDAADLAMELRIQAKNISTMVATLSELAATCAAERDDIPEQFREFFSRK